METNKKILIFSLAYDPFWGGAEIAVKEITDRISDASFDMITLQFKKDWPKNEKKGNINIHRINTSKLLFPFTAYKKAKQLQKKNNYDIVWSIMANRAGFSALFFKLKFPNVKFLLTLQEGDPFEYIKKRAGIIWPFVKPFFKKIFTKADYIQAISKYLANWAKDMKATCPIEVIPNGVDTTKFQIQNNKPNSKQITLITTSRLVPKNGIEDLIDATKILIDEGFRVKTIILGTGPLENNLKLKIENLKLQDAILLLGHVDQKEIPQYLSNSDIFVRASLSEGLGNSFLEAMASGLPVIGTKIGGIPDFIEHQVTGLFAEPKNPKSIAEQVKILIKNENLKNNIINNGKKLVFEKYNWGTISQKMQVVFSKILIQNETNKKEH
ncbi:MAG: glycosyltransferase family 4 protein [Candidatus Marinimicrobia bacterium]|nr:glycosyltransferase family 4 protein [Candidatus Neomarinimicrobiota bacterium]